MKSQPVQRARRHQPRFAGPDELRLGNRPSRLRNHPYLGSLADLVDENRGAIAKRALAEGFRGGLEGKIE